MEFKDKEIEENKIQKIEEEDQLFQRKNRAQLNNNYTEEVEEYSGLGALKDLDDDEDDLGPQYDAQLKPEYIKNDIAEIICKMEEEKEKEKENDLVYKFINYFCWI